MIPTRSVSVLPASVLSRDWGDETVVFNRVSGDVHFLDELSAFLFRTLRDAGSLSSEQLAAAAAAEFEFPGEADVSDSVTPVIRELAKLGLVEDPGA